MHGYIKTRSDFTLYAYRPAISWDLPVASRKAATGSVVLVGTLPPAVKDMWLVFDEMIWTIERVEPSNGQTTLTIAPAIMAFDRPLAYPAAVPETSGGLIAMALLQEWRDQSDEAYRMPYLSVYRTSEAPLMRPETTDAGLYSLPAYVLSLQDRLQVGFTIYGSQLLVGIDPIAPAEHVIFMEGATELLQQTYSRQAISKVTVVQSNASTDYYMDADGAISAAKPKNRMSGEWQVIEARDNIDPLEAAKEVFDQNVAANKISFASPQRFNLGDIVRTRLDGMAAELEITAIRKTSADSRWHYECGELQTSLSERLAAAESIEALGGISASGGSVKGNLGVKGRLSAGGGMDVIGPLHADGSLILSEESYGFELPTTNLEDGRLFFLLEPEA